MIKSPRVSVVLAVYNGEQYVREAIDSILNQTYKSFEMIVVDDGSTDGSGEILQSYSNYSNVTILENSHNKGLTESLNFGISVAKGEYIARIDSDDISLPHRLESQVKYLDSNPEIWLVGSWFRWIGDGESRNNPYRPRNDKLFYKWSLAFYCPFLHSSAMFRKTEVEQAVGLYDPKYVYAMDYDLWSRISEVAEVDIVLDILAGYREHDSSMTNTMPNASSREPIEISRRILESWNTKHEKIQLTTELVVAMRRFWISENDFSEKISVNCVVESIQSYLSEFSATGRVPEDEKSDFMGKINSHLLTLYIKNIVHRSNRYHVFKPKVLYYIYRRFGFSKPLKLFFITLRNNKYSFRKH